MDDFDYLDACAAKWQGLAPEKLTRQQQAVVDVVCAIGLVEGDGVEALWSECGSSMDRIIESFRMAGATEIAEMLQGTSFFKDIIAKTPSEADEWAYNSPEEEEKLTDCLILYLKERPRCARGPAAILA